MLDITNWVTPRISRYILFFWDVVSLGAIYWIVNTHLQLLNSINTKQREISFDSLEYYALVILVMPVIHAGQYIINHRRNWFIGKYYGQTVIVTFIGLLVIINILNYIVKDELDRSGYQACEKTRSQSVQVRGERWVYRLGSC